MMNILTRGSLENSSLFRKDQAGQTLFYPWGYPGVAYYVDDTKKKKIHTFLCAIICSLVGYFLIVHTAVKLDLIKIETRGLLNILAWAVFPLCYWGYVTRAVKPLKSLEFSSDKKPRIFYVLAFIMIVQVFTIMAGFYAYSHIPTLAVIVMISHFLYLGVTIYLMRRAMFMKHVSSRT